MKTTHTRIDKLLQLSAFKAPTILTDDLLLLKEACENDFFTFAKTFWHIVDPSPWKDLWHLQVIAEHLEALFNLEINYLIVNAPPRCGKTLISCALYPAWIFIHDPTFAMLYTSYSEKLVNIHHLKSRSVIGSKLYQQLWGDRFSILKNVDSGVRYETNKLGFRMISTIGGKGTGFGSDLLCVDDPHNAIETESCIMLDKVNYWWTQSMSSRWTTPERFRRLVNMQRLKVNDLTGNIIAEENDAILLRLPMEYEADYKCYTIPLKSTGEEIWADPRVKEKELLCPNLIPKEAVERMKRDLGSPSAVAGQLQQRPSPAEGGLFKKDWWQWWVDGTLPQIKFVIQSWDTALVKSKTACFSACSTWGIFDYHYRDGRSVPNIILLSTWKGKVEMPELREMAIRLSKNYYDTVFDEPEPGRCAPDLILIETQMNGTALLQELQRVGVPVVPFNPPKARMRDISCNDSAKMFRARLISPYIECGKVWLPARPPLFNKLYPFAEEFREACAIFPNDQSNDLVDSMSQAFMKMRQSGLVGQPMDYVPEPVYDFEKFKNNEYIV